MLHLARKTDPRWAPMAADHLGEILVDHAHLEKKAASNAITFLFRYPERRPILRPLSALAREELAHFDLVLDLVEARGLELVNLTPCPYAGRLQRGARTHEPARMLDLLVVAALIEARSCERMRLLAEELERRGEAPDVAKVYRGLLAAEARHHRLYLDLAETAYPPEVVAERLAALSAHEAEVLEHRPHEPRLHG